MGSLIQQDTTMFQHPLKMPPIHYPTFWVKLCRFRRVLDLLNEYVFFSIWSPSPCLSLKLRVLTSLIAANWIWFNLLGLNLSKIFLHLKLNLFIKYKTFSKFRFFGTLLSFDNKSLSKLILKRECLFWLLSNSENL